MQYYNSNRKWGKYSIFYPQSGSPERYPVSASWVEIKATRHIKDMHFFFEFGIIFTGRMERSFDGRLRELGPGDFWFHNMWEPHGSRVLSDTSKHLVFVIWPEYLLNYRSPELPDVLWKMPFMSRYDLRPTANDKNRKKILELGKSIIPFCNSTGPGDRYRVRLRFLDILWVIIDSWDTDNQRIESGRTDWPKISKSIHMVFSQKSFVSEDDVAQTCGMSRTTFSRRFERFMGIPFSIFALRHRMSNAASELIETNEPIKAIALKWGFSDTSHFYRLFKKHYGDTPARYREQSR